MKQVDVGNDHAMWRMQARRLLSEGVPPGQVVWVHDGEAQGEFDFGPTVSAGGVVKEPAVPGHAPGGAGAGYGRHDVAVPKVPAAFLDLAEQVACHAANSRWDLLYRMLWRMTRQGQRHLLSLASDPDVVEARGMAKAVGREVHKMHAFVRFRKLTENEEGREYFVAWFEPEHGVVERAAPFFRDRFSNMDWSIFTPRGCVHWIDGSLHHTVGLCRDPSAIRDEHEELWKTYYRHIFNPARLKLKAMQSEMPKKYWGNLPEADLIQPLSRHGTARMRSMLEAPQRPPRMVRGNAYLDSLKALTDAPPDDG